MKDLPSPHGEGVTMYVYITRGVIDIHSVTYRNTSMISTKQDFNTLVEQMRAPGEQRGLCISP